MGTACNRLGCDGIAHLSGTAITYIADGIDGLVRRSRGDKNPEARQVVTPM
ncbi:MAG: hypothetical protein PVSMB7_25430 [Chloroflexota bacterium]